MRKYNRTLKPSFQPKPPRVVSRGNLNNRCKFACAFCVQETFSAKGGRGCFICSV